MVAEIRAPLLARLFGTGPYVPDTPFLQSGELWKACGNTGNLLFTYSLSRMLDTGTTSVRWDEPISTCKNAILVMPLANQLGPHVDLDKFAEKLEQTSCEMLGIGLGAQGPVAGVDPNVIPEGSWRWLQALTNKAPVPGYPNVAIRGELTRRVIAAKGLEGHCVVIGCPSNFLSPNPVLGHEIGRAIGSGINRVVVAAGNPRLPQFARLEQSLVELVQLTGGSYVCQHPLELVQLSRGEAGQIPPKKMDRCRGYIHPELPVENLAEWFRRYSRTFYDVPSWLEHMKHFDVVIGTRIHGVMAGIQAGIPSVCLYIDSRTRELCETMLIPSASATDYMNGISISDVEDILSRWDGIAYDHVRLAMAVRFRRFIEENMLTAHGSLKTLAA